MPSPAQNRVPVQILKPELIEELKKSLQDVYGKEAVERTKKEITRKGYDTTGYGYQFVVNRLNEVLHKHGLEWTTQDDIKLCREFPTKGGSINFEYAGKLSIMFLDENRNVVASRHCFGGHQSRTHADAMKGAYTNALKKTAAMFGVGADAYEGTIDEDYRPVDEPSTSPVTSAAGMPSLTGSEVKEIEKEISAIASAKDKAQLKTVDIAINNLIGKVSGKQMAYLRKLVEVKKKSL